MYCSNCGNEVKSGLKYCNSCGGRINNVEIEESKSQVQNITTAIGYIGVFGVLGFVGLVKILLDSSLHWILMTGILLAYLATVFGICFLLIQKMSSKSESSNPQFQSSYVPETLKPANTNQLEEPKEQPASVVEKTTRTLDEMFVERK